MGQHPTQLQWTPELVLKEEIIGPHVVRPHPLLEIAVHLGRKGDPPVLLRFGCLDVELTVESITDCEKAGSDIVTMDCEQLTGPGAAKDGDPDDKRVALAQRPPSGNEDSASKPQASGHQIHTESRILSD
jgi:hypothetical protein